MPTASVYLRDKLALNVLSGTAFTPPASYLGLFNGTPTSAGGTEVTGGGYARVLIPASGWGYVPFGFDGWYVLSRTYFPRATSTWGSVGYYGVWDAPTGGNFLLFGRFSSFQTINADQTLVIAGGTLDVLIQFL